MIPLLLAASLLLPPTIILADARQQKGWGQGCLVSPDTVVTAKHVIAGYQDTIAWGIEHPGLKAEVLRLDPKEDIATLRLLGGGPLLPVLRIAKKEPEPGARLHWRVAGFGRAPWLIFGNYLSEIRAGGLNAVDGLTWPGMSGACVMNDRNEIVGILGAMMGRTDMTNARTVMAFLPLWGRKW